MAASAASASKDKSTLPKSALIPVYAHESDRDASTSGGNGGGNGNDSGEMRLTNKEGGSKGSNSGAFKRAFTWLRKDATDDQKLMIGAVAVVAVVAVIIAVLKIKSNMRAKHREKEYEGKRDAAFTGVIDRIGGAEVDNTSADAIRVLKDAREMYARTNEMEYIDAAMHASIINHIGEIHALLTRISAETAYRVSGIQPRDLEASLRRVAFEKYRPGDGGGGSAFQSPAALTPTPKQTPTVAPVIAVDPPPVYKSRFEQLQR